MKRLWHWLLALLMGAALLAAGIILPFLWAKGGNIIGGAGTPTMQYIIHTKLHGLPVAMALLGIALLLTGLVGLLLRKTVCAACTWKTSVAALGLSGIAAVGVSCAMLFVVLTAFGNPARYPIRLPAAFLTGILSLAVFMVLSYFYIRWRKRRLSWKGILLDVLTALVYFPAFFFAFNFFYKWLF